MRKALEGAMEKVRKFFNCELQRPEVKIVKEEPRTRIKGESKAFSEIILSEKGWEHKIMVKSELLGKKEDLEKAFVVELTAQVFVKNFHPLFRNVRNEKARAFFEIFHEAWANHYALEILGIKAVPISLSPEFYYVYALSLSLDLLSKEPKEELRKIVGAEDPFLELSKLMLKKLKANEDPETFMNSLLGVFSDLVSTLKVARNLALFEPVSLPKELRDRFFKFLDFLEKNKDRIGTEDFEKDLKKWFLTHKKAYYEAALSAHFRGP